MAPDKNKIRPMAKAMRRVVQLFFTLVCSPTRGQIILGQPINDGLAPERRRNGVVQRHHYATAALAVLLLPKADSPLTMARVFRLRNPASIAAPVATEPVAVTVLSPNPV